MGYTTKFKGGFIITPSTTQEFIEKINLFASKRHDEKQYPGIWCQWIIGTNGRLLWNGGEKFYYYVEWLQYLVDEFFRPQGYELNGKVNYRGERFEDFGVIYMTSNNINQICGRYDANESELIMAVAMDIDGRIVQEIF